MNLRQLHIKLEFEITDNLSIHNAMEQSAFFEMAAMPFPCNGLKLCCVNIPFRILGN